MRAEGKGEVKCGNERRRVITRDGDRTVFMVKEGGI